MGRPTVFVVTLSPNGRKIAEYITLQKAVDRQPLCEKMLAIPPTL